VSGQGWLGGKVPFLPSLTKGRFLPGHLYPGYLLVAIPTEITSNGNHFPTKGARAGLRRCHGTD